MWRVVRTAERSHYSHDSPNALTGVCREGLIGAEEFLVAGWKVSYGHVIFVLQAQQDAEGHSQDLAELVHRIG